MTEVVPSSGERADAASDDGRSWIADRYRRGDHAYVRLNMLTSLTGAAVGSDGTSDTLTSRVDRAILSAIRAEADVVVVGAQTVRAEGYVLPRRARLAVVSRSGDLRGHRFTARTDAPADQVLLLLPEGVPEPDDTGLATVVRVPGRDDLSPAGIVGVLRGRGLGRIVCEGGPSLASQFADAGLIDEFCLTTAPALTPVASPVLDVARPVATEVAGMIVDEAGFSYLRLRRT
ncbi:dihydrofolate reductase family protein [Microbacterium sp.]|uniref:dihydrofolate reductase family protein n=1 Tax=Microbacterium sp. TaxID=51671 RepID=UPI003734D2BE